MSGGAREPTRGPWAWRGNQKHHEVRLVAMHSGMLVVMDFVRWGAQRAAPRFRVDGIMERVDELVVPGPEHHPGEIVDVDHPDARLIAAAPELLEAVKALLATTYDTVAYDRAEAFARLAIAKAEGRSADEEAREVEKLDAEIDARRREREERDAGGQP